MLCSCDGSGGLGEHPGPCAGGRAVGLVPVAGVDRVWRAAVAAGPARPEAVVLAMWKPLYLAWGRRIAEALRAGGWAVRERFADTVVRPEVVADLAAGPALAVYVGHGRPRGWSGYRGLRWSHLAAEPLMAPVGVTVALACDTLGATRDGTAPFGWRAVVEGRSCAYLGAVAPVDVVALEVVAGFVCDALAGGLPTVGALLEDVDAAVRALGRTDVGGAWAAFRLVGRPDQPLGAAGPSPGRRHVVRTGVDVDG